MSVKGQITSNLTSHHGTKQTKNSNFGRLLNYQLTGIPSTKTKFHQLIHNRKLIYHFSCQHMIKVGGNRELQWIELLIPSPNLRYDMSLPKLNPTNDTTPPRSDAVLQAKFSILLGRKDMQYVSKYSTDTMLQPYPQRQNNFESEFFFFFLGNNFESEF